MELSQLSVKPCGYSTGSVSRPAPILKFTGSNVFMIALPLSPLRMSSLVLLTFKVGQCG